MRPLDETQTPILPRRVLERDPKPHRARRIRVQERAVLVRRHPPSDLGLLANDHALQDAGVPEPDRPRDLRVQGSEGGGAEGRGEFVQVVADFVDGEVFGFGELRGTVAGGGGGEGVLFEEEADLVAAGEEVVVPHVGVVVVFPGGEFGHGVVG